MLATQDIVISGEFIDNISFMLLGATFAILGMLFANLRKVK